MGTKTEAAPRRMGRQPEAYVRFHRRRSSSGTEQLEMQLGRAVWYAAGRPERVAFEWHGEELRIVPGDDGWKLHVREYRAPTMWVPSDVEIAPGRYAATTKGQAIIVGAKERES